MECRRLDLREYTIAWLCALPVELSAAQILLDQTHARLPYDSNDDTQYTVGSIGDHNVVIGCLSAGQIGMGSAATVATRMRAKFPNLRFGLMVGVGGGVPGSEDVRLGDVVVSQPYADRGGVIQYDFGKSESGRFIHTGFLSAPPQALLQALSHLQALHFRENNIATHLAVVEMHANFGRPRPESDVLFKPTYDHIRGEKTCEKCDRSETMERKPREVNHVFVHYGTIASGNRVIKDAKERDSLSSKFRGVLCFEMEAAGLLNNWPCLVIRGICDYADSHKNDEWKPYAAGVAAAYAKELLLSIVAAVVREMWTIVEPAATISQNVAGGVTPRTLPEGEPGMAGRRADPEIVRQEREGLLREQTRNQGREFTPQNVPYGMDLETWS